MPRKRGVHVELVKRDRLVLRMLEKARVMRTGDFVPLAFPSLPIARRRLRKLMDAGYIACFIEQLHYENRWVLDKRGRSILLGKRVIDDRARRAPNKLDELSDHRATVIRFWSLLVHHLRSQEHMTLKRFTFEWELQKHLGTLLPFRPDALAEVDNGDMSFGMFVEVDTGTEAPSYVVKNKFEVFERLRAGRVSVADIVPDNMLVLVPSTRRVRSLRRAINRPFHGIMVRVFEERSTELTLSGGWHPVRPDGSAEDGWPLFPGDCS